MQPHRIVERGLAHVLERRRLFPTLSVHENLMLGATVRRVRSERERDLEWVLRVIPVPTTMFEQARCCRGASSRWSLSRARLDGPAPHC